MDCREFEDQITPAVDQYLPKGDLESFREHAAKCPGCRFEFEAEVVTKSLVHERLKPIPTPGPLRAAVAARLLQGDRFWPAFFRLPYVRPALAFAITCIAVILLIKSPTPQGKFTEASVGPTDVIVQSLANYKGLVDGTIKPQMECNKPEHLLSFFNGKTEFPVVVPTMKECTLTGGLLSDCGGVKLAHVLYRRDAQLVYMYQVSWQTVMQGEKLNLPEEVRHQLLTTGWYMQNYPDGNSVVMWAKGQTLCSAVAHMPKDDLYACLTMDNESAGDPW